MIIIDTLFSPSPSWQRLPIVHFNQGCRVRWRQQEHGNEILPPFLQDFKTIGSLRPKAMMSIPSGPFQTLEKLSTFTITFVIEHHQHPLLLVEVKPPSDFQLDSGRAAAIIRVIQRLDEIGPNNRHADRLYAISAIGKMWRARYSLKGKEQGWSACKGVAIEFCRLRLLEPRYYIGCLFGQLSRALPRQLKATL